MNRKALIGLGAAALIIAVMAVMTANKSSDTAPSSSATTVAKDEAVLPDLKKHINDVAKIHVEDASTSLTLVKTGDRWGLEEKYNYPVKFDQVRKLVMDISELKKSEEKSSNESSYGRMEVEDVAKGAKSREVTMYDSGGKKIGGVILGKNYFPPGGGDKQHQFVRVSGDKKSWLAEGSATVYTDAQNWLDSELFTVPNNRVNRVVVQHSEGENVTVSKAAESDANYKLETIPDGREIASEGRANELAGALSGLRFDEVVPASTIDTATAKPSVTMKLETFDGLTVEAKTFEKDKKKYVSFHADVMQEAIDKENERRRAQAESDRAAAQAEQDAAAEAAKKDAENKDGEASPTATVIPTPPSTPIATVPPELVDPAKIKEEADKINTQVSPWLFVLPAGTQDRLSRKNEFYLKALPKPEETGPPKPEGAAVPVPGTYEPDLTSPSGANALPMEGVQMFTPAPPVNPMEPAKMTPTPEAKILARTPTMSTHVDMTTPVPTTAAPEK